MNEDNCVLVITGEHCTMKSREVLLLICDGVEPKHRNVYLGGGRLAIMADREGLLSLLNREVADSMGVEVYGFKEAVSKFKSNIDPML